ncbi:MAG: polysaccharide deacetylase [Tissierellia bacterium]|nr:polysaccharide deacetylase [Tissierellia bacterium]
MNKKKKIKKKYIVRRWIFMMVVVAATIFLLSLFINDFKGTSNKTADQGFNKWIVTNKEKIYEAKEKQIKIEEEKKQQAEKMPAGEKKRVFLTFDDGPNDSITPKVLDILDKYGVKATFFVVGKKVEQYPGVLKTIHEKGHSIGNHTFTHDYDKIYKGVDAFMEDFSRAEKTIKNTLGEDFHSDLVRFPGGSFEEKKQPIAAHLNSLGYHYFDWNAINGDGESSKYTADFMVNKFIETAKGKQTITALFHDSEPKQNSVDSLPAIIEWLQSEGYEFLTLDQR